MWKDIRFEMWTFANNNIFLWKIFALRRWINKNSFVYDIQIEKKWNKYVMCLRQISPQICYTLYFILHLYTVQRKRERAIEPKIECVFFFH